MLCIFSMDTRFILINKTCFTVINFREESYFNFSSNRPQCVRVGDIKTPVLVSNTGAPLGCVLSPFVYTLYTNDCRSVDPSTQFVRFSDDTAMVALLSDCASYQSYLSSVVRFSSWGSKQILHLNVSNTNEMWIDFRRNRTVINPIVINGEPVEQVDSFKYLGVMLHDFFHLHCMLQPCKRSLSSDCTFFESYELSTLIHYFFYAFTVA